MTRRRLAKSNVSAVSSSPRLADAPGPDEAEAADQLLIMTLVAVVNAAVRTRARAVTGVHVDPVGALHALAVANSRVHRWAFAGMPRSTSPVEHLLPPALDVLTVLALRTKD